MGTNAIHFIFALIFITLSQVQSAKVVKLGIEQLSLNAKRVDELWTATGNNGTRGMYSELLTIPVLDLSSIKTFIRFTEFSVPAQVPGGIYSDLDAFGGIFANAIYHDYNDVDTRWVGRTDWTFTREFTGM